MIVKADHAIVKLNYYLVCYWEVEVIGESYNKCTLSDLINPGSLLKVGLLCQNKHVWGTLWVHVGATGAFQIVKCFSLLLLG